MTDTSELQAENFYKFMEDGPRLRCDYNTWVVAKDTENGNVLIGGLGPIGIGEMWFKMSDYHKSLPGFDEAEEHSSIGGFGLAKYEEWTA